MKKISYKIFIAIVACSIVIASSISIISMLRGRSIIDNEARQGLKSYAENAAREMDMQLEHLKDQVDNLSGLVASTIDIQSIRNDPAYLQHYIDSIKPMAKYLAENGNINVNAYIFFDPDYYTSNIVQYLSLINEDGSGFKSNSYDINVQDIKNKKDEYGWYYAPVDAKKGVWSDPYLDTVLNLKLLTYSTPIIVNGNVIGIAGMDIKFDALTNIVQSKKIYQTGYAFLMNSNYNYLVHPSLTLQDNLKTLDNGIYAPVVADMDKNPSGVVDLNFNNTDKVMGYSHLANGFIVALTVPRNEIMKDLNDLTIFMIILIIAGALLSGIIALFIGVRIARPINKLSVLLKKAEEGDLTVRSDIKSSDEVGQLSKAFNSMLDKVRMLISEASELSKSVAASSSDMMVSSEEVNNVSEQVASAIQELAKGSTDQASSTEKGNIIITGLIEGLNSISLDMKNSEELALKALKTVDEGKDSVSNQEQKMEESKQASDSVWRAVSELSERSRQIGEILGVIKGIADQTNLLALNAAIEAARAGEQGKGFAVVADEVRKLAEQSGQSVSQIEDIIRKVQLGVESAVSDMNRAVAIVNEQENALDNTVRVFHDIAENVQAISNKVKEVTESAGRLNGEAFEAGQEMANIAAIAEEAAANSEEVSASAEEQTSVVSQIAQSAENLSGMAAKLEQSISKFVV